MPFRSLLAALILLAVPAASAQITLESPLVVPGQFFGQTVSGVPDVDGDGVGDLAVYETDANNEGRIHLFNGSSGTFLRSLSKPAPEDRNFAAAFAGIEDLNGDGVGDLIVGAPLRFATSDGLVQRAYAVSGADGEPIHTFLHSMPYPLSNFGTSVDAVPDVNGDGIDDILIGAEERFSTSMPPVILPGLVHLFSGADGELLRVFQHPTSSGTAYTEFGRTVAGVPDVNADGHGDVLVGAQREAVGGVDGVGRAYLFSGADGSVLATFTTPNPTSFGLFGSVLAALDDIDGDGRPDVAVSTTLNDSRVHLFSSATGARLRTLVSPVTSDGPGFGFFTDLAGVADANEDGIGDVLIGAPQDGVPSARRSRAYVMSGADGSTLFTFQSSSGGSTGFFGGSVASLPDIPGTYLIGAEREGRAYVVTGSVPLVVNRNTDQSNPAASQADEICDIDRDATGSQCTLRAAIELATALGGPRSIAFDLAEGDETIAVGTALPALPDSLTIAATPAAGGAPPVRIHGGGGLFDGLNSIGREVTIEGVSVTGFRGAGIALGGAGSHVVRNVRLGLDRDGAAAANGAGVLIAGPNVEVSGSVISGNAWPAGTEGAGSVPTTLVGTGVAVTNAVSSGVRLTNSLVGVSADSMAARLNTVGVLVFGAPGFTAEGNTILGATAGVRLTGGEDMPTTGAQLRGNVIGLLPTNQIPSGIPPEAHGVLVDNATGTRIGGAAPVPGYAPGNVISGWNSGVLVFGSDAGRSVDTRIAGNLIGTDTTGTAARPNRVGVNVVGPVETTRVGGWEPGERNVISGNLSPAGSGTGIAVVDGAAGSGEPTGTVVAGNYVGTDRAGTGDLGNERWGVYVGPFPDGSAPGGVSDVSVGVTEATAPGVPADRRRNVITNSGETNVRIDRTAGEPGATVQVVGNWIGLDANGAGGLDQSDLLTGTRAGVYVSGAARVSVGGWGAERNVIGGTAYGIWLDAPDGVIVGNYIGTDPTGMERRPNFFGVAASGSRGRIGLRANDEAVPNVISGNVLTGPSNDENDGVGVVVASQEFFEPLFAGSGTVPMSALDAPSRERTTATAKRLGTPAEGVIVAHNRIGTTPEGDAPVVAETDLTLSVGAWIADGADGTHVVRNVIGGNWGGLLIAPATGDTPTLPSGTRVAGNRVGTAAQTDAAVPNTRYGIAVGGAPDTVIGEAAVEGEGPNRIRGNATADASARPTPGISLLHPDDAPDGWPVAGVTLRRNDIRDNQGLGITRRADGLPLPNGPGNTDGTASFDTPVILSATETAGGLSVTGTTNGTMTVEVFADEPCDDSGYGEGRVFLGTLQSVDGVFSGTVDATPFLTWRLSATGTNVAGTTSEFSACRPTSSAGNATSVDLADGQTGPVDGPDIGLDVTSTAPGAAKRSGGTLYLALHESAADEGSFEGAAMSADGTTVTPNGVQLQRFWTVQRDGLDGLTYEACLRFDGLFGIEVPSQLVVVTRATRGEAWTPHATTRRDVGAEQFVCAAGLTGTGELALGADTAINPVPDEGAPDETAPAAFALSAWPNPARGATTLSLSLPTARTVRVEVFDVRGRRVARLHDGPLGAAVHALPVGTVRLPAGVYAVRASSAEESITERFTVVR